MNFEGKKRLFVISLLIIVILVFAACSSQGEENSDNQTSVNNQVTTHETEKPTEEVKQTPATENPQEPVTLNYYFNDWGLIEIEVPLIEKKFPWITINAIDSREVEEAIDSVNAGVVPDMLNYSFGSHFWELYDAELLTDLTPLIKKQNFDLTRYLPGTVDLIKSYSSTDEMLFLPYETSKMALYYNKEIFDKLGVSYPEENMTWDEVYELSKDLTRTVDGVKYRGFGSEIRELITANHFALPLIDPVTNKSALNTDVWKQFFENFARFHRIPGNEYDGNQREFFLTSKELAMWVAASYYINDVRLSSAESTGFDWDIVSLPKSAESKGSQLTGRFYGITTTSKHQEAAMQVIDYLMSDEVQIAKSSMGRMSYINNNEVIDAFSADRPDLKTKNLSAFFGDNLGVPVNQTRFDGIAVTPLYKEIFANSSPYMTGEKDINTVLKETEEKINIEIGTLLGK